MSGNFEQVEHGIYTSHILKREVLVIEHHPLLTFLDRHLLDVGNGSSGKQMADVKIFLQKE